MPLLPLRIRRVRRVAMCQKPQVVQGFRIHLRSSWRPAFVASGAADRRVKGMVWAGALALGAIKESRSPPGMRHGLQ